MPRERKLMDKHIKAAPESAAIDGGMVKGYASTFVKEPDAYGDIIAPGAFAESLKRWEALNEQGKYIPLLYGHNMDDPDYNIGRVTLAKEDEYGLYVEAEFDAENEKAQYVRKLVQEGRLYQFSFAFSILDQGDAELEDGTLVNELRKLDIYEVSLVQIPANQTAVVTEVKSDLPVVAQVAVEIVPVIKSGRRNSAKDTKELERIGSLASEIASAVNGLLEKAEDEANATEGKSCDKADAEDCNDEAEFVAAYKEAVKTLLKG